MAFQAGPFQQVVGLNMTALAFITVHMKYNGTGRDEGQYPPVLVGEAGDDDVNNNPSGPSGLTPKQVFDNLPSNPHNLKYFRNYKNIGTADEVVYWFVKLHKQNEEGGLTDLSVDSSAWPDTQNMRLMVWAEGAVAENVTDLNQLETVDDFQRFMDEASIAKFDKVVDFSNENRLVSIESTAPNYKATLLVAGTLGPV